ncbi:MAG: hypothetical protein GY757_60110 [bacterium]|nr:hypothetical protein [bacterium]
MKLKFVFYCLSIVSLMVFFGCSGNGDSGSAQQASKTIQDNVNRINEEQDALNAGPEPVNMPDSDELETRMEEIFTFFCDEAANNQVAARMIIPDAPEGFYLSDTLAMHLNKQKENLEMGYSFRFENIKPPHKSKHGKYHETVYNVFIEIDGTETVAVELMYETQYNKFHEMKCWTPE